MYQKHKIIFSPPWKTAQHFKVQQEILWWEYTNLTTFSKKFIFFTTPPMAILFFWYSSWFQLHRITEKALTFFCFSHRSNCLSTQWGMESLRAWYSAHYLSPLSTVLWYSLQFYHTKLCSMFPSNQRLMTKISPTDSDSVFRWRAKSVVHFVILLIITTTCSCFCT